MWTKKHILSSKLRRTKSMLPSIAAVRYDGR